MGFIAAMLTCKRKNFFDWQTFFGPEMVSEMAREEASPQKPQNVTAGLRFMFRMRWELVSEWEGATHFPTLSWLFLPAQVFLGMDESLVVGWPLLGWAVLSLLNGPSCTSGSSNGLLVFMPIPLHYLYRETLKPAALKVRHTRNLSQTFSLEVLY